MLVKKTNRDLQDTYEVTKSARKSFQAGTAAIKVVLNTSYETTSGQSNSAAIRLRSLALQAANVTLLVEWRTISEQVDITL